MDQRGLHLLEHRTRHILSNFDYGTLISITPNLNCLMVVTGTDSKPSKVILNTHQVTIFIQNEISCPIYINIICICLYSIYTHLFPFIQTGVSNFPHCSRILRNSSSFHWIDRTQLSKCSIRKSLIYHSIKSLLFNASR